MKKTFLPLFIIILTMCCLLSACGENNKTSNQNSTTQNTDSSVTSVQNTSGVSDTVVVPNVVGENYKSAKQSLEELGLKVRFNYKILQVKEIIDGEAIYYDNDIITDQSHKQGTIVANNTEVELTVNQWNEFKYNINNDSTITLTECGDTLYYPNKQLYIPKEYNGYKVSCVKNILLNNKQTDTWGNAITYFIPQDVVVDGETSVKIIRY